MTITDDRGVKWMRMFLGCHGATSDLTGIFLVSSYEISIPWLRPYVSWRSVLCKEMLVPETLMTSYKGQWIKESVTPPPPPPNKKRCFTDQY